MAGKGELLLALAPGVAAAEAPTASSTTTPSSAAHDHGNTPLTAAGVPAQRRRQDVHGSTTPKRVECPQVLNEFYSASHVVDDHNRKHQDLLGLECAYQTTGCWLRLKIVFIGTCAVDACLAWRAFGPSALSPGRRARAAPQSQLIVHIYKQFPAVSAVSGSNLR